MVLLILSAITAILLIYLVYSKIFKQANYWERHGIPPAKNSSSLFGTIKELLFSDKPVGDRIISMYKNCEGAKCSGYTLFGKPILLVRDPELINHVLIKDFTHFEDRIAPAKDLADLMNSGLANVSGNRWRVLRHKLTPTFTSGKLKMMFKKIKDCSDDVVLFLKQKNGADIETRDFLFKFLINVIGNTAFGIEVDALNEEKEKDNEFLAMSKSLFQPSLFLQLKLAIYLVAPNVKDFLGLSLIDKRVNKYFPKFVQDLINHRKQHNERRNDFLQLMLDQKEKEQALANAVQDSDTKLKNTSLSEETKDLEDPEDLEMLEHLKNVQCDKNEMVFTDNIIAAQALLFISGGSDTTATALSFALHYLAVHQDVQKRLQEEFDTVLSENEFSYETVNKMKYLEQVLNEVLRLRPPGGILTRICTQDYVMPGTSITVEKGCLVQIPALAIHQDPQYFPDPDKFNPDRFEDMDSIPKGVFYPFGGGPRMCIAMRLAMLEMKVFLGTVLSVYNVVQSEKTPVPLVMCKRSFSQHVKGGLWVKFENRK